MADDMNKEEKIKYYVKNYANYPMRVYDPSGLNNEDDMRQLKSIAAWIAVRDWNEEGNFQPYLRQTLKRRVLDMLGRPDRMRTKRHPSKQIVDYMDPASVPEALSPLYEDPTVYIVRERLERKIEDDKYHKNRKRHTLKEVYEYCKDQGEQPPYVEISKALKLNVNTVAKNMNKLKELVKEVS